MTSVTPRTLQPAPADPDTGLPATLRITRGAPDEEQLAAVTAALLAVVATRRRAPDPAAGSTGPRRARWSREAAPRGAGSWRLPDPPR